MNYEYGIYNPSPISKQPRVFNDNEEEGFRKHCWKRIKC